MGFSVTVKDFSVNDNWTGLNKMSVTNFITTKSLLGLAGSGGVKGQLWSTFWLHPWVSIIVREQRLTKGPNYYHVKQLGYISSLVLGVGYT